MANAAIKAIIFDCFGVLYNDPTRDFLARQAARLHHSPGYFHELTRRADTGQITEAEFYAALAAETGLTASAIRQELSDLSGLNTAVVDLITSLKPTYTIGMLTNTTAGFLEQFLANRHLRDLFQTVVLSSEVGLVKPQPELFQLILKRLGTTSVETVFIDDRPENVQGAAAVGLAAILFRDAAQTRRELEALLK